MPQTLFRHQGQLFARIVQCRAHQGRRHVCFQSRCALFVARPTRLKWIKGPRGTRERDKLVLCQSDVKPFLEAVQNHNADHILRYIRDQDPAASEVKYHKTCYRNFTNSSNKTSAPGSAPCETQQSASDKLLIVTITTASDPPSAHLHQPVLTEPYVERLCRLPVRGLGSSLAYHVLLVLLCTLLAFKTRRLPDNYNESRYIAFCVDTTLLVWLVFVPAYFSATVGAHKVMVLALIHLINSYVQLSCLFLPRLHALYRQTKKPQGGDAAGGASTTLGSYGLLPIKGVGSGVGLGSSGGGGGVADSNNGRGAGSGGGVCMSCNRFAAAVIRGGGSSDGAFSSCVEANGDIGRITVRAGSGFGHNDGSGGGGVSGRGMDSRLSVSDVMGSNTSSNGDSSQVVVWECGSKDDEDEEKDDDVMPLQAVLAEEIVVGAQKEIEPVKH